MTKNKIKATGLQLTEQIQDILRDVSEQTGVSMARIVEDAIWIHPAVARHVEEHAIVRLPRALPGRKPKGDE